MLLYFFVLSVLLYLFVGLIHYLFALRVGNELGNRIKKMDDLYEQSVNKIIDNVIIEDYEKICNELFKLLEPSIISMVSFINKSKTFSAIVKYNPEYFPNLLHLFETGFQKNSRRSKNRLNDLDIERIKLSIKEAIIADIQHRIFKRTNELVL